MNVTLRLGKTRDSRSRAARHPIINVAAQERLLEALKHQKEFTQYLLRKGYSISTTSRYVKDVAVFIKWAAQENIAIEQVGYTDVLYYIQGKRNEIKQRSISASINSIKHYFNFLVLTDQRSKT